MDPTDFSKHRSYSNRASLQELPRHALCLAYLDSANARLHSGQSRQQLTNASNWTGGSVMNSKSASSFESIIERVNTGVLTLQHLLTISKRLVRASDQSSTDLTSATAMDHVSYCKICLDLHHPTSKCAHLMQTRNIRSHSQPQFPVPVVWKHEQRTAWKTLGTQSTLQVAKHKSREPIRSHSRTI